MIEMPMLEDTSEDFGCYFLVEEVDGYGDVILGESHDSMANGTLTFEIVVEGEPQWVCDAKLGRLIKLDQRWRASGSPYVYPGDEVVVETNLDCMLQR